MSVTPLPLPRRTPIADPADVAGVEALVAALTGVVAATGGLVALMGQPLLDIPLMERASILTEMYDDGEVVFGWRDGRDGAVVNMALERLDGGRGVVWRAELFVEDAEGHGSAGALADRDLRALSLALLAAIDRGAPRDLPTPGAALARALAG